MAVKLYNKKPYETEVLEMAREAAVLRLDIHRDVFAGVRFACVGGAPDADAHFPPALVS